jgi:exosortase A
MPLTSAQRDWLRALIPLAVVMLALVLLFRGTVAGMVAIWWRSETFTHAFIVPPMVVWLAWRRREELLQITPRPAYWMLLPMAVLAMAWLLGELVAVNAVTQLAVVAMLVLAVPAVLGTEVAWALMFPLCFAFFAVPIGEFMLPVLMQWTADFTIGALRLSGVPVYREGLRFVIPTGSWSVVEACSGVRYLIASFMVGSLYAHLNYQSNKRRWIFVVVSIIVPVIANWLRAYMIVMLGHLSNNRIATGVDHLVYGWVFFGVVIMALFTIGARWSEPDAPVVQRPRTEGEIATGGAAPASAWVAAALFALVAALPSAVLARLDAQRTPPMAVSLTLPEQAGGGWTAMATEPVNWTPDFRNPSAKSSRAYAHDTSVVGVHTFYYQQQQPDSKLVSSTNFVLRANDYSWNPVSTSDRRLEGGAGGGPVVARESVLVAGEQPSQASRERIKIWQLYWIDGEWTSSDLRAKLRAVQARLTGRSDAGAAVLLYASDRQPGGADAAMTDYWQANRGLIEARLVAARDGQP